MFIDKPSKCANCRERIGTERFVNDPDHALGWVHSPPQLWCRVCVLTEQVKYAQRIAAELPILQQRLIAARHDADEAQISLTPWQLEQVMNALEGWDGKLSDLDAADRREAFEMLQELRNRQNT